MAGRTGTPGQAFKIGHRKRIQGLKDFVFYNASSICTYKQTAYGTERAAIQFLSLWPQNQSFSGYVYVFLCLWNYIYLCTDTE